MNNVTFEQKKSIGLKYVLDNFNPSSAYGIEQAKKLSFYLPSNRDLLLIELDNLQKIIDNYDRFDKQIAQITHLFSQTNNIIKSIKKIATATLDEVEFFEIKLFLLQLDSIKKIFDTINRTILLNGIEFSDTTKALDVIDPDHNRIASFYITSTLSQKLSDIREQKRQLEQRIDIGKTPALVSQHTLLAKQEEEEEYAVRCRITEQLRPYQQDIESCVSSLTRLDLLLAKASIARRYHAIRPTITQDTTISVQDMFNPMVADNLALRDVTFTPISLNIGSGVTIITGANMGGKSIAIKTLALNVMLAQMGFFVFAQSFVMPLFDFCELAIAEAEHTDRGLSTFGGEIERINRIFGRTKDGFGLVIIDEFAKGTNATEGQAIFSGVVKALNVKSSISIMTTHYDNVAINAAYHYQVAGLSQEISSYFPRTNTSDNIIELAKYMNYGLIKVALNSYTPKEALTICKILGLDQEIMSKIDLSDQQKN